MAAIAKNSVGSAAVGSVSIRGLPLNGKNNGVSMRFPAELLPLLFVFYSVVFSEAFGSACPIRLLTGLPCPACGMTHACIEALKFDFAAALYYHPLFPLAIAAAAMAAASAFFPKLLRSRAAATAAIVAGAAFITVFVLRITLRPEFLMPLNYSYDSALGALIELFTA